MNRSSNLFGLSALMLTPLLFSGCHTEEPIMESSGTQSQYNAEVLKLKAGASADYDQRLSGLNRKFSIQVSKVPSGIADQAASNTAKTSAAMSLIHQENLQVSPIFKRSFKGAVGTTVTMNAQVAAIPGEVNPADPMIFLVQILGATDKKQGGTDNLAQVDFRILAFNDDDGSGNLSPLSSSLTYTLTHSDSVYMMWLVVPFSNAAASGKVNISFEKNDPTCPGCTNENFVRNSITIGGGIVRFYAGNDFLVARPALVGDPHVYVFKTTDMDGLPFLRGFSNGEQSSTNTSMSRVFSPPFAISTEEANFLYNFALVDNDVAGTIMNATLYISQR